MLYAERLVAQLKKLEKQSEWDGGMNMWRGLMCGLFLFQKTILPKRSTSTSKRCHINQ